MSGVPRMARRLRRLPVVTTGSTERNAPRFRGECEPSDEGGDHARPCPYVSCVWHLLLDVSAAGSIRFNAGPVDPDGDHIEETLRAMNHTCALDVIDNLKPGEILSCEELAVLAGLDSRQAAHLIIARAMAKLYVYFPRLRNLL